MAWTKEQQRTYWPEWAKRNRDKVLAHAKKYRETHREITRARVAKFNALRGKEYSARYRAKHPERRKQITKRYRDANREAEQRYRNLYRARNLGKLSANAAARRALKLRSTPKWFESAEVERIYHEARKLRLHVDHVVPLKSALVCGLHCVANLQLLTPRENLSKGNRVWPDMP